MSTLVSKANDNYLAAFKTAAEHTKDGAVAKFGTVEATTTGTDIPSFNRIFALTDGERKHLEAAIRWMTDRGDPFWLTTTDEALPAVEAIATSQDLVAVETSQPGMVLTSLDELPPQTAEVSIDRVTDESDLQAMVDVFIEVFEVPLEPTRDIVSTSTLDDDAYDFFLGRIDEEAVACGQLLTHDGTAGVYSVATVEGYRGRGIGTDVTWEVLRAGRDVGCDIGVLQSSAMGYSVYESMGFETVVDYHFFKRSA